tara:strand:- start:154 stop:357 length:204 start_codon:yes stop_codon:yes gene_type:complete
MSKKQELYQWTWNEKIALPEYIKRVQELVSSPVRSIQDMDGDMLMSDYRDLLSAMYRLENIVEELNK